MAEPGNADPVADREPADALAQCVNDTDDLVARDERQLRIGEIAVNHVQVGPADGAGFDPQSDLTRSRDRIGPILQDQLRPRSLKHHRAHRRPDLPAGCHR